MDIWHIIGKQNVIVDTLSREPVNEIGTTLTSSLDFVNMAILQDNDSDKKAYRTAITGLHLVFETVHNLAHQGVKPTQKLITQHFVWHGIKKDVTAWV